MKLRKFIIQLKKIAKTTNNLKKIDVRMADNFAVRTLILKNKTVYITDVAKNGSIKKYRN